MCHPGTDPICSHFFRQYITICGQSVYTHVQYVCPLQCMSKAEVNCYGKFSDKFAPREATYRIMTKPLQRFYVRRTKVGNGEEIETSAETLTQACRCTCRCYTVYHDGVNRHTKTTPTFTCLCICFGRGLDYLTVADHRSPKVKALQRLCQSTSNQDNIPTLCFVSARVSTGGTWDAKTIRPN